MLAQFCNIMKNTFFMSVQMSNKKEVILQAIIVTNKNT